MQINKIAVAAAWTAALAVAASSASAGLVTDKDDARTWQGAGVGTFADLFYGSNTDANRQLVVDDQLLDDGLFDSTGYSAATMINSVGVLVGGRSNDLTGTGSFGYTYGATTGAGNGNLIDEYWVQTDSTIGHAVWDLGFDATKAAIFNTIDHGPLPGEAIEATVYLSNGGAGDPTTWAWTQAVTERVWLEGFMTNTDILWDGFAYAVGTGTTDTFRYASIIWGGPGALISDGDNEINGVLGLQGNFTPGPAVVPLPPAAFMGLGLLAGLGLLRRSRRRTG